MLASNLHLEKTAQLPELSNQGLKRQNQGDSSFSRILQNEMESSSKQIQKTKEPKDGQKIEKKAEETQSKEASKEKPIAKADESKKSSETKVEEVFLDLDSLINDEKTDIDIALTDENIDFDETLIVQDSTQENLNALEQSDSLEKNFEDEFSLERKKESKNIAIDEVHTEDSFLSSLFEKDRSKIKALTDEEQEALLQNLLTGAIDLASFQENNLPIEEILKENPIQEEIAFIGKENALITVIDERTLSSEDKKSQNFVKSVQFDEKNQTANLLMDLNPSSNINKGLALGNEKEVNSSFQSMLAEEIKNSAQDFVKTGSIILKDNNKGLINLILKPESLGDVKIRLQISDTLVSAKIIVDSKEALHAFKESMGSLKEAFEQGGFEAGSFDLSWSGQGESEQGKNEHHTKAHFYTESIPELLQDETESDERILALMKSALQYGTSIVNVVA